MNRRGLDTYQRNMTPAQRYQFLQRQVNRLTERIQWISGYVPLLVEQTSKGPDYIDPKATEETLCMIATHLDEAIKASHSCGYIVSLMYSVPKFRKWIKRYDPKLGRKVYERVDHSR